MTSKSTAQVNCWTTKLSNKEAQVIGPRTTKSTTGLSSHQMNKPKSVTQEDYQVVNPKGGVVLSINTTLPLHSQGEEDRG